MKKLANKKRYKRFAVIISVCAILTWIVLGAGASLAWFSDTSEELTNIFHFGEFDLAVSHRTADGEWVEIDGNTSVFDNEALYEPGYVQVVYLMVENRGDVPFDFHTAVSVLDSATATNAFGQKFWLHEYLKFGVAIADSEMQMDEMVSTREKANAIATMKLQNYATEVASLEPGQVAYLALIVRMPEEVGNEANYRGDVVPKVELGIIVKADQQR